jgi:hypothetical protein
LLKRWLVIAETSVDELEYYILTSTGKVLTRKSVWGLTADELRDPAVQRKLASYDVAINISIGDSTIDTAKLPESYLLHPKDDLVTEIYIGNNGHPEFNSVTLEELDEYLHSRLILPRGGDMVSARV